MSELPPELRTLPVGERIELVSQLWDSIAEDAPACPLSEDQRRLLESRLAARADRDDQSQAWGEFKAQLPPKS